MWRVLAKVGGQLMGAALLVAGLILDGADITHATIGDRDISWQWFALGGAVIFILFSAWSQLSLYMALDQRRHFRKLIEGLEPFVFEGNRLMDMYCRTGIHPDTQRIGQWMLDTGGFIKREYREAWAEFENDGDVFRKSEFDEPVSCKQLKGRLLRLSNIMRELRQLASNR